MTNCLKKNHIITDARSPNALKKIQKILTLKNNKQLFDLISKISIQIQNSPQRFQPKRVAGIVVAKHTNIQNTEGKKDAGHMDLQMLNDNLPILLAQLEKGGFYGEIFIVINPSENDDTNFNLRTFFSGINVKKYFLNTVPRKTGMHDGEASEIEMPDKVKNGIANYTRGLRLIFVVQNNEPRNYGKMPGLRDAGKCIKLIYEAGSPPKHIIMFDVDTVFVNANTNDNRNPIKVLIGNSEQKNAVVGTKVHLCNLYQKGNPISWSFHFYNMIHGEAGGLAYMFMTWLTLFLNNRDMFLIDKKPYNNLWGGGIVGPYNILLSSIRNIIKIFPDLNAEDFFLTILLRIMNIPVIINREILHLNYCSTIPKEELMEHTLLRFFRELIYAKKGKINVMDSLLPSEKKYLQWLMIGLNTMGKLGLDLCFLAADVSRKNAIFHYNLKMIITYLRDNRAVNLRLWLFQASRILFHFKMLKKPQAHNKSSSQWERS